MKQTLDAGLPELGLDLPESTRQTLCDFGAAVIKQNEVMNLTAITDPEEVVKRHFLDSAALLPSKALGGRKVIDVGTGAGLPGLPLKILVPSLQVTLLDSLNEKYPAPSKEKDPMAWAAHQNNLTAMAEEIVLKELVYN